MTSACGAVLQEVIGEQEMLSRSAEVVSSMLDTATIITAPRDTVLAEVVDLRRTSDKPFCGCMCTVCLFFMVR